MKAGNIRTVLMALCSISTVFAQYNWNNPTSNLPSGCTHKTYHSDLMNTDVGYTIYLPPDYDNGDDRYPVVYSLHGMGGNENSNCQASVNVLKDLINADEVSPLIMVFVCGRGNTFYSDAKNGSVKCESSIMEELIPHIDKTYRTKDDRTQRAVEGISMGGFGALMLGFKHPDMFGSIGTYDAALVTWDTLSEQQFDQSIPTQIFGSDREYFNENSYPFTFAAKNAETITSLGIKVRMTTGDNDFQMGPLYIYNLAMRDTLNALGIELDFNVLAGGTHGAGMNTNSVTENLKFHSVNFASTATAAPRQKASAIPAVTARTRFFTFSTFSSFQLPCEWNGSADVVTVYTVNGKRAGVVRPDSRGYVDGTSAKKRFGPGLYMVKAER